MSIEINEDIRAIWFVSFEPSGTDGGSDWMAAVWDGPEGPHAMYRHRYYNDDKAFDSDDEKTWYAVGPVPGENGLERLIGACRTIANLGAKKKGKKWELLRGKSTLEQFAEQLTALPFAHSKRLYRKDCIERVTTKDGHITITLTHQGHRLTASATGLIHDREKIAAQAFNSLCEQLR